MNKLTCYAGLGTRMGRNLGPALAFTVVLALAFHMPCYAQDDAHPSGQLSSEQSEVSEEKAQPDSLEITLMASDMESLLEKLAEAHSVGARNNVTSRLFLGPGTYSLSTPLDVAARIAFVGNGTIMTCAGAHLRGINVWPVGMVSFSGITFIGCSESAIYMSVPIGGGPDGEEDDGLPHDVQVHNCTFLAHGSGTAIFATGSRMNLVVSSTLFQATLSGTLPVLDEAHSASIVQGGALVAAGVGSLMVNNCTFVANARAILAVAVPILVVNDTMLIGNRAVGQGGAIAVYHTNVSVTINYTTFLDNFVVPGHPNTASLIFNTTRDLMAMGGALYVESPAATSGMLVFNCTFSGNQASSSELAAGMEGSPGVSGLGGAMYARSSVFTIQRSMILNNTAWGSNGMAGGARIITSSGDLRVLGTTIAGNVAGHRGGGMYLSNSGLVDVQVCTFRNNRAGAVLSDDEVRAVLDPTKFAGPQVVSWGGGLLAESVQEEGGGRLLSIVRSSFTGNMAALWGGGLIARGYGEVTVSLVPFTNNHAGAVGGAINLNGAIGEGATLTGCDFAGNSAGVWGSIPSDAIYGLGGAIASLSDSTVRVTMNSCTFEANVAGYAGGAVRISVAQAVINGCTFTSNRATVTAGAVSIDGNADLTVTQTTFISNSAGSPVGVLQGSLNDGKSYGGALHAYASYLLISDGVTFVGNQASLGGGVSAQRMFRFIINTADEGSQPVVFVDNLAAVGGAMFISDFTDTLFTGPSLLVTNNTAATGGAIAMLGSYFQLNQVTLSGNSALLDPTTLTSVQHAWADNLGCGLGGGGALCITQLQPQLVSEIVSSSMTGNKAVSGGAVYHKGLGNCDPGNNCFRLVIYNTTLSGNSVAGGGGAGLLWQHLNTTTIACAGDAAQNLTDLLVDGETYAKANWAIGLGTRLDPCPEWQDNTVLDDGYGALVASSPFSLSAPSFLPFYTSNADMAVSVDVLDYYSQVASGMGTSESEVLVRANLGPEEDSVGMSGETQMTSRNGTSVFTALRLRAKAGVHQVSFTATTALRTLAPAPVLINVRPCNVSEFLAPVTLDQCLPCDAGTFNTDPTSTSCSSCPEDAECGVALDTDTAVSIFNTTGSMPAAVGTSMRALSAGVRGIIVPADGFWHTNPFSEAVQECPNKESCLFPNRAQLITLLQGALLAGAGAELAASAANATAATPEEQLQVLLSNPEAVLRQVAVGPKNNPAWMALLAKHHMTEVMAAHQALLDSGQNALHLAVELYGDALCAEGYMGNVCGSCTPGWGSTDSGNCKRCPPWSLNTLFYSLMSLVTLVGLAMTLRVSMRRMMFAKRFSNNQEELAPTPSHHSLTYRISGASGTPATVTYPSPSGGILPPGSYPQLQVHTQLSLQPVIYEGGSEAVSPTAQSQHHAFAAIPVRYPSTSGEPPAAGLTHLPSAGGVLPPHPPMPPPPPAPAPPVPQQQQQYHSAALAARVAAGLDVPDTPPAMATPGPFTTAMHALPSAGPSGRPPAMGTEPLSGDALAMMLPPLPDNSLPAHAGMAPGGSPMVPQALDALAAGTTLMSAHQQLRRRSRAHSGVAGSNSSSNAGYASASSSSAGAAPGAAASSGPPLASRGSSDGTAGGAGMPPRPPAPSRGVLSCVADAAVAALGLGAGRASQPTAATAQHMGATTRAAGGTGEQQVQAGGVVTGGLIDDRDSAEEGGHAHARSIRPPAAGWGQLGADGSDSVTLDMGGTGDGALYPAISAQGVESEKAVGGTVAGTVAGSQSHSHQSITPSSPDSALNDPTTLKIFVSYVQVLAMVRNVPLEFPTSFGAYMRIYNTITSVPGTSVSIDCSLPDYGPNMSKAIIKVIVAVTAPIYCSVAMCCVWVAMFHGQQLYARKKGINNHAEMGSFTQYMKNRMTVTWLTAVFFFYPSVVSSLLSIFSCTDLDTQPNNALATTAGLVRGQYWDLDLEQRCYQGPHMVLAMVLGVPGLLLFALGVPVCSAVFLHLFRTQHTRPHFLALYSFLYEEYRDAYYMWESVIMLRKLGVAALVVFLANEDLGVQMLVVMAVIMAALALQTMLEPYDTPSMNALEKLSLWTTLATLYLSLYLVYSELTATARMAISTLLLLINSVTMSVFAFFIFTEYYNETKRTLGVHEIPGDLTPEAHKREVARVLTQKYGRVATLLTPVVTTATVVERKVSVVRESGSRSLQRVASRWSGGSRQRSLMQTTSGGSDMLVGREGSTGSRTGPASTHRISGPGLSARVSGTGLPHGMSGAGTSSGQLPSPVAQTTQPAPARRMDAWAPSSDSGRLW